MKRHLALRSLTAVLMTAVIALSGFVAILPAQTAHAAPQKACNERKFSTRTNRRSICVKYIQKMLNKLDDAGLATDNVYGPKTKAAVITRQQKFKADDAATKVDGVVGPQTWDKLCALKANYPASATNAGCDTASTATACNERTFSTRTNARDATCVNMIKRMLNLLNDNPELAMDAPYGRATKKAVTSWQQKQHQANSAFKVDGVVGPQTWDSFCNAQVTSATGKTMLAGYKKQAGC